MAKKIIVVRVGGKETQIAHIEYTSSNPTVYGCVRFPTPEKAVQDGMIVDMAELAVHIHKACVDKGIKTREVIFTITSGKIASREVSIPVVNKAKIEPLVMAKIPDLFPIDAEKYVFSYVPQGKPRVGEDGNKIQDVMVFAAPSDLIDSYYKLADAAGLHIISLEADGNAIFQIMKRQAKNTVSMSIHMNDSATLVNVISDNRLLLQRVVPYGINVFTEVMTQDPVFQASTDNEAYTLLKRNRLIMHNLNAENPNNDPSLAKRIEVTDNASFLLGNIVRVIEYYNTKYKDQPIQEIICMGKGCAIAGIHELMSNELGIPAFTPAEIEGIRFNRTVNVNAYILQYINCFGAVFETVNFVSREVSQRAKKKGSMTGAVLAFVGLLMITVLVCGFSVLQLLTTKAENERLSSRVAAMSPIQNEYDTLTAIETNRGLIEVANASTVTNNNKFHNLLKEIENYVPKTFKIQDVTSDEQSVSINAVSTDKLISLSALIMQLNKIEGITNVKLDSITLKDEAMTKQKQYAYLLTFDYKILVPVQEQTQGEASGETEGETQEASEGEAQEEGEQP